MTYYAELASFFVRIAVNSILIGTPISIGILIVLRLTHAASPRARYLLTVTAFLAAAVLPFVLTVAPTSETPRHSTIVGSSSTNSAEVPVRPLTARLEILQQSGANTTSVDLLNSLVGFLSQPSLSIGLLTLWLAGACLLLAREGASHLRVARARRQWTPATANIRERLSWPKGIPLFVDNEFGPCALGVFESIVVIPARLLEELSLTAARQIACHELDHLRWRDPSVHAVMRIVRASLWFSAPLWYLDRATRLEREAASDRAAVNSNSSRLQPDIAAMEYAATLVAIAKTCARMGRRKHAWIATQIGNESGLNDRVRRLMAISSRLTGIRLSLAFATLIVSGSFLFILPVARLESKHSENDDEKRPQQQTALANQARFEMGPSKEEANKPASLAILKVQHAPQNSTLTKTRPDAVVQEAAAATTNATSTATDNTNLIQPVPFVQPGLESQMAALGYKNLTSKQLADMRAYAVGPAYVAEMAESGYSGLSADMLIRFKWFGVSRSFIREMSSLGYDNLSPRTLVSFREWGVTSDYIRAMRSRISGSIRGEELVSLRLHGASADFVDKLKALGYANLNAGQLISMRLQGVSIAYIEDLQAQGHKSLSADDLIWMRMRGSN